MENKREYIYFPEQRQNTIEIEKGEKVILEVGCGSKPYFIQQKEVIGENEHYIGLDLPRQYIGEKIRLDKSTEEEKKDKPDSPHQNSWFDLGIIQEELSKGKRLIKGKADLVVANGLELPLRDKSADKIVFSRVLGAPPSFFNGLGFCKNEREFFELWSKTFVKKYVDALFDEEKAALENKKTLALASLNRGKPISFTGVFAGVGLKWDEFQDQFAGYAKEKLLTEASRVLKDDGELIIYDYQDEFYGRDGVGYSNESFDGAFEMIKKEEFKRYKHDRGFKLVCKKSKTN